MLPVQPAKELSCRNYGCNSVWPYLPLSQGKSHFGVILVPVRAAYQVWWYRTCFGSMPAEAARLDGAGLGNAVVGLVY